MAASFYELTLPSLFEIELCVLWVCLYSSQIMLYPPGLGCLHSVQRIISLDVIPLQSSHVTRLKFLYTQQTPGILPPCSWMSSPQNCKCFLF
jgi:hypothetical protein